MDVEYKKKYIEIYSDPCLEERTQFNANNTKLHKMEDIFSRILY